MPDYREHAPPLQLASWVECAWSFASEEPVFARRIPPDGALDIVYDRNSGLRVIGTMTRQQSFDFPKGAVLAGVRFRPGMSGAFLGVSPAELTDGAATLEDVWGGRCATLRQRLDDANSTEQAAAILLTTLRPPDLEPDPVQKAITAISKANGAADLDQIASQANLSSRQFRRRCLEESGLTPKHLCRVLRFRYAWRLAENARRPDWAAIAAESSYFDQAHLIRDFHEFAGLSPMAVFSNTSRPLVA